MAAGGQGGMLPRALLSPAALGLLPGLAQAGGPLGRGRALQGLASQRCSLRGNRLSWAVLISKANLSLEEGSSIPVPLPSVIPLSFKNDDVLHTSDMRKAFGFLSLSKYGKRYFSKEQPCVALAELALISL